MADAPIVMTEVVEYSPEISWAAVIAGALVATATIFFLLALGGGVGLSLTSVWHIDTETAQTVLTLGAIYFLAAQAFGFAVGGHVAGRLIGPLTETRSEERFHAVTHGLVTWALCVVATVLIVTASGTFLGGAALNTAGHVGAASVQKSDGSVDLTAYWVDALFRETPRVAQNTPAGPAGIAPALEGQPAAAGVVPLPRSDEAVRAEAGRILAAAAGPGKLAQPDRDRLALLVSERTGLAPDTARMRVDSVEAAMEQRELQAAEAARKTAQYLSLWTALALAFGAICAAAAAMRARELDDRKRGLPPAR
jgi:hypothetical protein